MGVEEFFDWSELSANYCKDVLSGGEEFFIDVRTIIRDAERLAFKLARRMAKKKGFNRVFYRRYSGQNPDFMNGSDDIPHNYSMDAVLF